MFFLSHMINSTSQTNHANKMGPLKTLSYIIFLITEVNNCETRELELHTAEVFVPPCHVSGSLSLYILH